MEAYASLHVFLFFFFSSRRFFFSSGRRHSSFALVSWALGSVTVTVVDILANGNLVVRGEKKLGLAEGTEVIQVAGVIRPQDVGPNGTVQSLRLANAQIAYRGTGDLANATKVGWGTSLLHKFWPF